MYLINNVPDYTVYSIYFVYALYILYMQLLENKSTLILLDFISYTSINHRQIIETKTFWTQALQIIPLDKGF